MTDHDPLASRHSHRRGSDAARIRHDRLESQTQLVSMLSRLMGEQAAQMSDVVGEYERAAVDLELAIEDVARRSEEKKEAAHKLGAIIAACRSGAKRSALLKGLNDLAISLAGD